VVQWPWNKIRSKLLAAGRNRLWAAVLCAAFVLPVQAIDGVTLVLSEEGQAYADLAEKVRQAVAQRPGSRLPVSTLSLAAFRDRQEEISRSGALVLVVAVGLSATQAAASLDSRVPVLSVLVPRSAFERVARERGRQADSRGFSAIYLDQPFSRQLSLVRHALPERTRLGLLAGPVAAEQLPLLQAAARGTGFKLGVEKVAREDEIIPALNRLLRDSEALLFIVPDPLVYNRRTIQSILLTTYRYQVPVVGFSQSYVRAGALTAVYSAPVQIGQQVAEIALALEGDKGRGLPPPQYPKYFSVAVNHQVARSMGIEIDNEAVLYDKVRRSGEQEP
jgi:ABC-type uncharacterized transport system, periplasmic component